MAKDETESIDLRVRRRLRDLRTERGLTLAQIAERANLDVSTLSRLESGKRRLTLEHLPGLAAALGVSIDELIGAPPSFDPRVRGEAKRVDGMTLWPLGEDEHILEPGEAAEFSTWTPHWFGAVDGPVEVIIIVGPDGERLHLHG